MLSSSQICCVWKQGIPLIKATDDQTLQYSGVHLASVFAAVEGVLFSWPTFTVAVKYIGESSMAYVWTIVSHSATVCQLRNSTKVTQLL